MLRLIQSNHMHALAQLFCEQSQQSADPFIPTTAVVQSFGIGQWLKLQLANHRGISANLDCVLPANYIWRLYRELLPHEHLPRESPFDRERLAWRLMRLIPTSGSDPLLRYLDASGDPDVRLFQLSYHIAQLFDQYLVYRPEWPLSWQRGIPLLDADTLGQQTWQISLWQQLVDDEPAIADIHRAALHEQLKTELMNIPRIPEDLNGPLSIFGLSSIAPMHLDTFRNLSALVDVDIYFLNPCQHYWGDVVAPRDQARRSVRTLLNAEAPLTDEDYLTVGNPLLGSLGKQGREYLELLLDIDDIETHEMFIEMSDDSALARIKNDILNLEYGGSMDGHPAPRPIAESDHSIQVHSTHSRMREVEILCDQLLAIFDAQPNIDPIDVIVMAPDISTYGPFIDAVFRDKIHFGIADRSLVQQSTLITAFLNIISLPLSRMTGAEIVDLLEVPAIARRFGLDEAGLNRISLWINETGVRWEANGEEKQRRWGLPPENNNTWRFGLDRLLLGYAMDDAGGLYANCLPYAVDAADSELLGTLCHFIEVLTHTRELLSESRDAKAWRDLLINTLHNIFEPAEAETLDVDRLQVALDHLDRDTLAAHFEAPISSQLIRFWLEQQIMLGHQAPGFISGGITFATLVPMRSIPFKVVCLLGMNDADFPRDERPVSFDLMHVDGVRKGDRSRRTDDRYLFLEALLSAQQFFYISYEGKGARDNQTRPPATVVGELLDYVTTLHPDFAVADHPLQPFSEHYYDGTHISYRQMWFDALRTPPANEPFIAEDLIPRDELTAEFADQLAGFLQHPARYFLQNCLGVYFDDHALELKESESFSLDGLESYRITEMALHAMVNGIDEAEWRHQMQASGMVLNNSIGESHLGQRLAVARSIYAELQTLASGEPKSLRETVTIDGSRLAFAVNNLYGQTHIDMRPGTLRKRQLLGIWVKHLCLNACGHPYETVAISQGRDGAEVSRVSALNETEARAVLRTLLQHYDEGIRRPVHFLPECSFTFASALTSNGGKSLEEARRRVSEQWLNERSTEGQDPYWCRLDADDDLFNGDFERIAQDIYTPLITCWSGK